MLERSRDLQLEEDGYFVNVRQISERLDSTYEPTDLGNKDDPFEELVYVVLSTRTREKFYQAAFQRLKELVGDWNDLPDVPTTALEKAIGSAGLASKKAKTLKAAAAQVRERIGHVSLDFVRKMDTKEADRYLRTLPGVGIKTARCILMYSLDRAVFPMDTHCRRVSSRIGWFAVESRQLPLGLLREIERAIPPELRSGLHIREIQHGRGVCSPKSPDCGSCVIRDLCEYGCAEQ